MAFDVTAIKAKTAPPVKRTVTDRAKKDKGPNPWLDKTWETGLWASYNEDLAFEAEFKGNIEMVPAKRGKNVGEPIEKVTGEASEAIKLIRDAATILGIGVAVRYRKGRNGFVSVTWHGKTRKKFEKKDVTPATA